MVFKANNFTIGALFSFLSAVCLALTLPYFNWWWLVWVAFVPYFFALRRAPSISSAFLFTMIFGSVYCIAVVAPLFQLTTIWWANGASIINNALIVWLLVLATAIYGSLFFFPFAYLERRFRVSHMRDVLVAALVWSVIEYVRSRYALLGYGWGTIGYTLVDATYVRGNAALVGVYGLSFLIITVNMLIVLVSERIKKNTFVEFQRVLKGFLLPREKNWTVVIILIWLCAIGYGMWQNAVTAPRLSSPLHVALIVANSDDPSVSGGLYRAYRGKIIELLKERPETNIILLPENTFPFFLVDEGTKMLAAGQMVQLDERDELYKDFILLSKEYFTTTFAIGLHTIRQDKRYNTLVFYRNGKIVGMLHKERLVPFFEYAPLGLPIPLFESLTQGDPWQEITLSGNTLGMLMCSEISDGSILPASASLILSPSNDGVFASKAAGYVHNVLARMRAIESGAYLLRANRGGISSIISPKGEIIMTSVGDTVLFETLY